MAGGVFLEKKARLRWLEAYFPKKKKARLRWLGAYFQKGELEGIGRKGRQKGKPARIAKQDGQKW